eukprot:TRINITY_DN4520_c0_g1_i1.p1 TRINITY_DN4520_c0_g1~~TRINITY_DN4520_c0_g1_i1.p1  ORF type:complete len:221 (-),score=30.53 TRINITY_DN4520_c0_g1_i1:52-714(-)
MLAVNRAPARVTEAGVVSMLLLLLLLLNHHHTFIINNNNNNNNMETTPASVTRAGARLTANIGHPEVRSWPASQLPHHVRIRYIHGAHALVFNGEHVAQEDHWGFIALADLDPAAVAEFQALHGGLGNLQAVHNNEIRDVPWHPVPEHDMQGNGQVLHVISYGTMRSGPHSFMIGGVDAGQFHLHHSHHHVQHIGADTWYLGRSDQIGRWGYVEGRHLRL